LKEGNKHVPSINAPLQQHHHQHQQVSTAARQQLNPDVPEHRASSVLHPAPSFALPTPSVAPSLVHATTSPLPVPETALGASTSRHTPTPDVPPVVPPPLEALTRASQDASSETGDEDTLSYASSHTPLAHMQAGVAGLPGPKSGAASHMQSQLPGGGPNPGGDAHVPAIAGAAATAGSPTGEVAGASPHNSPPRPSSLPAAMPERFCTCDQATHSSPALSSTTHPVAAHVAACGGPSSRASGEPVLSRHSSFSRRSTSSQVAVGGVPGGVVAGSSDDESESEYSTKSGRSGRRLNR
jgi:hypothetical protein